MTEKSLLHRSCILEIKREDDREYLSIENNINDYYEQVNETEYNIASTRDRHIKQRLKSIIEQLEKKKKNLELDHPKYEYINVLSENSESIFSPEYERNYKDFGPRKGQIYFRMDLIERILREAKIT
jgi:hypothetical protein